MKINIALVLGLVSTSALAAAGDASAPGRYTHQVTGLFAPHREAALREAFARIPGITLVRVDFEDAEVTLEYVPGTLFPGAKPEQSAERLDNLLRTASGHTFGVKPRRTRPPAELE